MSNTSYNKNQKAPLDKEQEQQDRTDYGCGLIAGKRAWEKQNFELYKKARQSQNPWETGFLKSWNEAKNEKSL